MTLPAAATFSKDGQAWGLPHLTPVKKVDGSSVLCADEVWRIDWTSSLGQWLFGQPQSFRNHLHWALDEYGGLSATLTHELEYKVADRLASMLGANVPGWEGRDIGVRFLKSGSDATLAAIRLARAVTGRDTVICFRSHYHGWGEQFIARTDPALGIPDVVKYKVVEAEWGNELSVNHLPNYLPAAVIFEHPPEAPPDGWPEWLRAWCDRNGSLLIADEVVTGLRYGLGGACGLWGYEPDLVCMGKALGNGAAVSALVGPMETGLFGEVKPLMARFADNCPPFVSTTTGGNILDLAVADWVLAKWDQDKVDELWSIGWDIVFALKTLGLNIHGHGARSVIRWDSEIKQGYFIKAMADRGHLVNRPQFPNLAQTVEDRENLGKALQEVMAEMEGMDQAEMYRKAGPLPRVLFKGR